MNTKIKLIAIIVITLLLVAAFYTSTIMILMARSEKRQVELESSYRLVMGTFARVVVVAKDTKTAEKCVEAAFAEIYNVDNLMSDYKSDSEIGIVNKNAADHAVEVGESTFGLLQKSVEFSKLTEGAFDITVGPLVDLFHAAQENKIAPDKEQIDKAKSRVGFEKLILDPNNRTVKFAVEGMRLDLGGIAKGYAIDKAIEAAHKTGAIGAMVDIGGDIRCFGKPAKGKNYWLVGLQNPDLTEEATGLDLVLRLKIKEGAITTSGDYQQFVIIDGKQYSHIIDRRTGTSSDSLSSVTIIADNATDADALATAVSVMGAEKGLALIEKLPETEAILIPSEKKCQSICSSNADKYLVNDKK
ncbi:MAG: FAD:protein FMN transferase [Sedimentisphaerales bacterium]|nr:FAD:protein FMN transferase [Sedimentisphaerales bacterium]